MKFLLECRAAEGISTEEDFLMFLSAFQQASRNLVRRQLTWFRNNSENDVQLFTWIDVTQPLDDIVEGMAKEYLRPAGVPSCRDSGAIHKEASYKDGKILKTYRTSNRCSSLFSFEICFEVVGNPLKHMMHKL
jgi:tRNA dimethylallyltransferase